MAERAIVDALIRELDQQGQSGVPIDPDHLTTYPVNGSIDVMALAEAVETALLAATVDGESNNGKTPAELNAANDG
jgi:hypothetical protein